MSSASSSTSTSTSSTLISYFSIPNLWNEMISKQQWYRLTPLLYEHLDEQQNRDVLAWIDYTARKDGHVPLWYFSLRNRIKHIQHVLMPQEFEKVLTDFIVVTIRIVEDIIACKNIYGIVSSNAFVLLRNKLISWIRVFESKPWKPIPLTRGTDSWSDWITSQPIVQSIFNADSSSSDSLMVTNTFSNATATTSVFNTWPPFTSIMTPFLENPEKYDLTSTDDLKNVHCAWTSNVYHSGLNTIVFGNVLEKLIPTLETNQDAAKLQRDQARKYMFQVFKKMNTWDEFWNVALADLIPF
jgi:hypothetical protein